MFYFSYQLNFRVEVPLCGSSICIRLFSVCVECFVLLCFFEDVVFMVARVSVCFL